MDENVKYATIKSTKNHESWNHTRDVRHSQNSNKKKSNFFIKNEIH